MKLADDVQSVASQLAARTGGNPFYVTQLVLDAQTTRRPFDAAAVPDAVAQLVAASPRRARPDLRSTLALAAVAGGEFDGATLESCSVDRARTSPRHRRSTRTPTIHRRARTGAIHLRARARARCRARDDHRHSRRHACTAAWLTRSAAGADPALLAHHYLAAGPSSTRGTRRAHCSRRVPRDWPMPRGRWRATNSPDRGRSRLRTGRKRGPLIGLGRAQRALGNADESRVALESRARARPRQRAGACCRAGGTRARGRGGRGVAVDVGDADRAALLREALDGLDGDDDVDLRVAVLGELALALVLTDAKDERDALTTRCLREARGSNNADGLAVALQARRVAAWARRHGCPRRRRTRDPGAPAAGGRARAPAGGRARARRRSHRARRSGRRRHRAPSRPRVADELGHPYWSWATTSWRGLVSIIDGRFEEAETLAFEALAHQAPAEHPEALPRSA